MTRLEIDLSIKWSSWLSNTLLEIQSLIIISKAIMRIVSKILPLVGKTD